MASSSSSKVFTSLRCPTAIFEYSIVHDTWLKVDAPVSLTFEASVVVKQDGVSAKIPPTAYSLREQQERGIRVSVTLDISDPSAIVIDSDGDARTQTLAQIFERTDLIATRFEFRLASVKPTHDRYSRLRPVINDVLTGNLSADSNESKTVRDM